MRSSLGVILCTGVMVATFTTAAAQPTGGPAEESPEQPAGAAPEQPAGAAPEQPAGAAPEQPAGAAPEQPAGAAPEQPAGAAPEQPAQPDADRRDDGAWVLYHSAYSDLARGQNDQARARLAQLVQDHPDHPAAAAAARVIRGFGGAGPGAGPGAAPPDQPDTGTSMDARERPSAAARAELGLYQSLHGIALGVETCLLLDCGSAEAYLGLALLGGAGGLTGSLMFTRDGITQGHRALLNSGTSWGVINAAFLLVVTDADDAQRIVTALMGGQLGGLALGQALWSQAAPTEGQVALTNTFGIWSGVLTLMAMGLMEVDDEDEIIGGLLIMADVGLVAGAITAYRFPEISRGRTFLIDAGGILGALGGGGMAILIGGDNVEPELGIGSMLAGTLLGLGGAAYLSRHWDGRSAPPARLSLVPHRDGGIMAGVTLDLDL